MLNIDLLIVIAVFWAHFLGDFIFQTDRQATGKSRSNAILLDHVTTYGLALSTVAIFMLPTVTEKAWTFVGWIALNVVLHFATDYVTSRLTSYFWQAEKRHWFFVTIGADQSLHFTCLFVTYWWLFN